MISKRIFSISMIVMLVTGLLPMITFAAGTNASNLGLHKAVTTGTNSYCGGSETAAQAVDGNPSTKWCTSGPDWLMVDLGATYGVSQLILTNAGNEMASYVTRDYDIQTSIDGSTWTTAVQVTNNTTNIVTHDIAQVLARYVKLNVTAPTQSGGGVIRINEFSVMGDPNVFGAGKPRINTQPTGAVVNAGDSSPTLSVNADVSDGGTLSYQWYRNTTNSSSGGTEIAGAGSASFMPPVNAGGTTYYYVVVTNTNSSATLNPIATATSNAAAVEVKVPSVHFPTMGYWTSTGPNAATVSEVTYGVKFAYNINSTSVYNGQTWEFSTIAAEATEIFYNWHYSGIHAWFQATAGLSAFVERNGTRTTTALFNSGVAGNFDRTGISSFQVYPGDKYGFTITGRNYDSNSFLLGSLEVQTTPHILGDVTPPITIDDAPQSSVGTAVLVNLTAIDVGSGVAATYYRVDGGLQQAGTQISITTPGTHNVIYWSVDLAGNIETQHTVTITIQPALASASFQADHVNPTNQNVNLTISFPANAVVRQFSLDNQATWNSYSEPIIVTENRTIYARYQDSSGNWSSAAHYVIDNIDKIAPEAPVFSLSTTAPAQQVTVTIEFSSDTVVRRYSIWGENQTAYTGPFVMTMNRNISAYATDAAGNTRESVLSISNIDRSPPNVSILINEGALWAKDTEVNLTFDDGGTGATKMRFSDNNVTWSDWEPYMGSRMYSLPSGDGVKTIYMQFQDDFINISQVLSRTITLDTLPPIGTIRINDGALTTDRVDVTLTLDDGDSNATYMQFSSDSRTWSDWEMYNESKSYGLTPGNGEKRVYVRLKDAAGNASESFYASILLEQLPVIPMGADGQLHIDDIVNLIQNGTLQEKDMNDDGVFNREDVVLMLKAIISFLKGEAETY